MGDETTQEKEVKTSTSGGFDFNAALERVKRFTTTDARAKVDGVLVDSSEVLNKSLPPPLPSLFRSHSSQLMLTTSVMAGILTAYPVRRISGGGFIKTFVYTAVFTGALVGGAAELVKYKWR